MRSALAFFLGCATAVGVVSWSPAAKAQGSWNASPFSSWFDQSPSRERYRRLEARRERVDVQRSRRTEPKIAQPAALPAAASSAGASALVAVISISDQSLTVWDKSGPLLQSRVSTGQSGYATPTGVFSVIQRNRFHESNIYSGAPMPFMQRITWSGIALHAGVVPNYPASHGCIRLPFDVAPKLWALGRIGMRVVVAPSGTRVQPIEHQSLPVPHFVSIATADQSPIVGATLISATPALSSRQLNPLDVAVRLKKEAAIAVDAKKKLAREALATSQQSSVAANNAATEHRLARLEFEAADADAKSLARTAGSDDTSSGSVERAAAKIAADDRLARSRRRLELAAVADAEQDPAAFAAARAARDAEMAADEAPEQAKEAARRMEPISIFISRKEGQIFVRQGFEPVLDAAIEIEDALTPLGTHVFTAMAPTADGSGLQWSVVTMPASAAGAGGSGSGAALSASDALSRVNMPKHVREEIARRLWTGASLVISDEGISRETGRGTDFVILTK